MGRFTVDTVDLDEAFEIEKRRKSRMLEVANSHNSSVHESIAPFSKEWLARNSTDIRMEIKGNERMDIQNIGSGTRCMDCGMLHFCWTPSCAVCNGPMDYNLGSQHNSKVRQVA
tara:strand:+ start:2199 stop:2540 length:342 start_codon:yes stop_codon:yes gene_type:complete